ncbi:hypothetical protein KAT08_00820 [Candidatus Babeliales bacterium]|nr:hypothetical protein [Candidatus Babeliales bacterium]
MICLIRKEKAKWFFLKTCFLLLLSFFATSHVCATFIALDEANNYNYNQLEYNIFLFSDYHGKKLEKYDKQQLEALEYSLVENQNQKTNPKEMLILVEDPADLYKDIKANVLEKGNGLLIGLIKKLRSLTLKNTKIKNCDIRDVCGKACGFFNWCYPPASFAYSPNKIIKEKKINPYSFSFADLFEELNKLLNESKKIKKNLETDQCQNVSSVIDVYLLITNVFEKKLQQAQILYEKLLLKLKESNINSDESILDKATQFFLDDLTFYDYENNYTKKINNLKKDLKTFAQVYPNFSHQEWKTLKKQYERERDNLIENILTNNSHYTNESILHTNRYTIYEPLYKLTNILLELFLLYQIITNISKKIIVFAGAKHTKSIVEMMDYLGIKFKSFGEDNTKNPTLALDKKYIDKIYS